MALAIVNEAKKHNINYESIENFKQIAGGGLNGDLAGKHCLSGNRRLMEINSITDDELFRLGEGLSESGKTPLYFSLDGILLGVIAVADTVKATSKQAINELVEMGIDVIMLTGDNKRTAESIALKVGASKVISEVYPEDKEKEIRRLQE